MSFEANLTDRGIVLPPAPKPMANYVTSLLVGDMLYLSGHGPVSAPGIPTQGKVGKDLSTEEGYASARQTCLGMLATVREALGSLDKVERVVKVLGLVNCEVDYSEHPKVINGCSDLLVEVFGEKGRGTRSAIGAGSLPGNIATEIEAIFQVRTS